MYAVTALDQTAEMEHEESCLREGQVQYQERVAKRIEKQQESLTDYGKNLVSRTIAPLSAAITKFLAEAQLSPGKKHTAVKFLREFDADVVAFITAREVIDSISGTVSYLGVADSIGRQLEDERRFSKLADEQPRLYETAMNNLKANPEGYKAIVRKKTLVHVMNKFQVMYQKWDYKDRLHLGLKLLELFIQSTGLVRMVRSTEMKRKRIWLEAQPELIELLTKYKERAEFMHPFWQPMLTPPKPWSTLNDGGYYHPRLKYTLVKTQTKGHAQELATTLMPDVYQAVNSLQETPWRINTHVLETVKQVWDAGLKVEGLPSKQDIPLPPPVVDRPVKGVELSPEQLVKWKAWKDESAEVFRKNRKDGSKRIQTIKIILLAEKFASAPAIWFPARLDFRGRMYPRPQYLTPQGSDLAKSLLEFGEGKVIDARGEFWLAVHLANTFGEDKVGLDARESWARLNSWKVEQVAADPLTNLWWTEADKPFQFLAACLEWSAYLDAKYSGETFISHLPIMVDGSCNGLQHYAAMLKDEVSGQHVNLVPGPKPSDIYQTVADAVTEALKQDSEDFAKQWLDYGIDRKIAKRPTMVLPYGGTRDAVRTYILQAVQEADDEANKNPGHGKLNPFGKSTKKATSFLAKVMWQAMHKVVVGPLDAMSWLRKAAQAMSKENLPLVWTTPTGFKVQQMYRDRLDKLIKTKVGDEILQLTYYEDGPGLNKRKQATALAPNFVHSLDAAALMLTINLAKRHGVTAFAAVHDSYGTHAADMDTLQVCLRDVFVEMYRAGDTLEKFSKNLPAEVLPQLPPVPTLGHLDLENVHQCDYFFA
jgi:DNA-directed RNA polymerase